MSHRPSSLNTDYHHQLRWHDGSVGQRHPAPFWPPPVSNDSNHYNAGPGAWPPSSVIVNNALVGASHQYRVIESPNQHAYASRETHIHHGNGVHQGQYPQGHYNGHYSHDSRIEVAETYGHHGEVVSSPIEEHPYQHGMHGHYPPEHSSYPRGWSGDSHTSSEDTSTDAPDEYRKSIARHCDEIHASGSHGLESDNNGAHFHSYRRYSAHEVKEEEPEHTSAQYNTQNEWHSEIAAAAYNTPVHHSHSSHVPPPMVAKVEEPLMEPPIRVPSQQHLAEYMYDQQRLSQSPHSPVTHYQPSQASPTNRLPSTPPSDRSDYGHSPSSPYQHELVPTPTSLFSRQGLEHEDGGANRHAEQQQQQPLLPTPYPGSSQSVLKLTTTKKVAEKKQALACLFCRERKIACGRPDPESEDQTCNQCARRHINCEYPKESRRGQHKRTRRKKTHDHDVNQSSPLSGQ